MLWFLLLCSNYQSTSCIAPIRTQDQTQCVFLRDAYKSMDTDVAAKCIRMRDLPVQ